MNVVYLHAGADSFEKSFVEKGHTFHSISLNKEFKNIPHYNFETGFDAESMERELGHIDVLLASPDCKSYSRAAAWFYKRDKNNDYKTEKEHGINCDKFNQQLLKLIQDLKPTFYFIENPHGLLRQMPFMKDVPYFKVTYCSYGDLRNKPTDIFTNHTNPGFKTPCNGKQTDHTHISTWDRGTKRKAGVEVYSDKAKEMSLIPRELCDHIVKLCEEGI